MYKGAHGHIPNHVRPAKNSIEFVQYSRNHGLYIVENREIRLKHGAASQIRTGHRVPWAGAPWEPSDLTIEKRMRSPVLPGKQKSPHQTRYGENLELLARFELATSSLPIPTVRFQRVYAWYKPI